MRTCLIFAGALTVGVLIAVAYWESVVLPVPPARTASTVVWTWTIRNVEDSVVRVDVLDATTKAVLGSNQSDNGKVRVEFPVVPEVLLRFKRTLKTNPGAWSEWRIETPDDVTGQPVNTTVAGLRTPVPGGCLNDE